MKCDFCRDAEAIEKRGTVNDPMNGETKSLYLCTECVSRWDDQEKQNRIEHARKYGRGIDIWEAENVE